MKHTQNFDKIILAFILILFYIITSALSCQRCDQDYLIKESRSWLPYKGINSKEFVDKNSEIKLVPLRAVDTVEWKSNECNLEDSIGHIDVSLYLDDEKSDSIYLNMDYSGYIFLNAVSDGGSSIRQDGLLKSSVKNSVAKKLSGIHLGNHIYEEVILCTHNQAGPNNIDSVFLANGFGLVGFKYHDIKFVLK